MTRKAKPSPPVSPPATAADAIPEVERPPEPPLPRFVASIQKPDAPAGHYKDIGDGVATLAAACEQMDAAVAECGRPGIVFDRQVGWIVHRSVKSMQQNKEASRE